MDLDSFHWHFAQVMLLGGAQWLSGSVVECLTWDQRAAGSSLTGVTALYNWKIVDGT